MPDSWSENRRKAEAQAKLVVFKPAEHWSTHDRERGFKCYAVHIGEKLYGTVYQTEETTYKKAGRLRYGDRKVKRWLYDPEGFSRNGTGLYYTSRKAATEELMVDHIYEPARVKERKRVARKKKAAVKKPSL